MIDNLDANIVKLLQEDGRQPNTVIARKLNIAEATVRKRIERLLRDEIIQVGAWADPLKIGYQTYAYIQISVEPSKLERVVNALAKMPEIAFLAVCAGHFDIAAAVFFRSNDHIYEFLTKRLLAVSGITATTTVSMIRVVKRDVSQAMLAADERFAKAGKLATGARRRHTVRRGRPAARRQVKKLQETGV